MRPPSLHSNFFSSLKQVEKRLQLESPTQSINFSPSPPKETSTQSLSTPMYLHIDQELDTSSSTILQESSEPPLAFLSSSPHSLSQNLLQEIPQEQPITINQDKTNGFDDIQLLMQLLGLSDFELGNQEQEEKEEEEKKERVCDECCGCEGGLYEKIVGVKGPKCKIEVERLERWIRYFLQNGEGEERKEPLRLAFLLLGKAAFDVENGGGGGFGGLEFPSTIEEYLKYDPPKESN
ncbi:hypothetical protein JCGZ_04586 [Jatropha curcas]|uniref:Uncharacterized protein n=1 Tax=Jatropha curcas TaxID=180498 RepID=A0A067KSF8_JATCU|nr:hypothetical protein JCGZ_04586 [Jatropha curcas]